MKKRHILTAAGILAAALTVAGCGSIGGGESETTTSAEATETTTTEKETTTADTTAATTESTTTKEAEETTSGAESTETDTTPKEGDSSDSSSASYSLEIINAADGFEKTGDLTCSSATAEYTYSLLNDATRHEIESRLDNEAVSLSDEDLGIIGDAMYVSGKTDTGYSVTAYRYIGAGNTVSAYAGIQYLSENPISPADVVALLSDDYISY